METGDVEGSLDPNPLLLGKCGSWMAKQGFCPRSVRDGRHPFFADDSLIDGKMKTQPFGSKSVFQFNSKNVYRETEQVLSPPNKLSFSGRLQRPAEYDSKN